LPEMGAIWSEENKFQKWLDVEIAVCEVHAEMGRRANIALYLGIILIANST